MDMNIQNLDFNDGIRAKKKDLTLLLFKNSKKLPQIMVKCAFFKSIMDLEEHSKKKSIDKPIKIKIWKKISPKYVQKVRRLFIGAFSKQIFDKLDDEKLNILFKEQFNEKIMKNKKISESLHLLEHMHYSSVVREVLTKEKEWSQEWMGEVVKALELEGVTFPTAPKEYALFFCRT